MIGDAIQAFLNLFRFHKLKLFALAIFAAFFLVVLFPYDDLSEVVSTMVAERTNNQVLLQFDKLGFEVLPFPALAIQNVVVESSFLPTIQASSLSLAPSLSGFLSFRPGFNARVHDVWKGQVHLDLMTGKKNDQGTASQIIRLEIDRIDVNKANEALELPLKLQGAISGEAKVTFDPSLANQPEGDVSVFIKELRFPSGTLPTQMGPVNLPGMSWSQIQMKGKLSGGKLTLDQLELGSNGDLVNGTLRGEIDMKLEARGAGQTGVRWGAYQFQVDLNVSSKLEKDLSLFLFQLNPYKSTTTTGSRYKFKISGVQLGALPSLGPSLQ